MLKQLISVFWPSFLIAALVDVLFFALLEPDQFSYKEEPIFQNLLAAYTVGFLIVWLLGICSSALTCYFQRGSDQINRCSNC